jgi:hypothetical protein
VLIVQYYVSDQMRDLVAELDRTMDFFRLEPRRVIRESDD